MIFWHVLLHVSKKGLSFCFAFHSVANELNLIYKQTYKYMYFLKEII